MTVTKFKMFGRKLAFEEHPYQAMLPGDWIKVWNPTSKTWEDTFARRENETVSVPLVTSLSPDRATEMICEALDQLNKETEVTICYSYFQASRRDPENPERINLAIWINPLKKSVPVDFSWCPRVLARRDGVPTYELFKRTKSFK